MELGGSDAFIVLEDADLDKTVKWAVWGKMNNTGQCCVRRSVSSSWKNWPTAFSTSSRSALAALKPETRWTRRRRLAPCPRKRPW